MEKKEAIELYQISEYIPHDVNVKYYGIINGKELGRWEKENKDLDFFEQPETEKPNEILGWKFGKIKKAETYLKYWKLRVGNGHKGIYKEDFGKNTFLVLRPLSDLTIDIFDFIYNKEVDYPSIEQWILLDAETRLTHKFSYSFWQELFKYHFDVFGLIKKGLAIDINTLVE